MRKVRVAVYSDPYSPWCWAAEGRLRRLEVEFGDQAERSFVLVGLARELDEQHGRTLALAALDARGTGRMAIPAIEATGEDGSVHVVSGFEPYERWRDALVAAGAEPEVRASRTRGGSQGSSACARAGQRRRLHISGDVSAPRG